MFYYLYKITNLINNREYIGVHKAKSLNNSYYGSGKLIKLAIKKYGKENFKKEILMLADSYEEVLELEKLAVTPEYIKSQLSYNLREGGMGSYGVDKERNPFYGKQHTKETKLKLSLLASQKLGNLNPFYGKQHSKDFKEAQSLKFKGIKVDYKRKGWWVTPYSKFRTYREAASELNLSTGTIKRRCKTSCNNPVGYAYNIPKIFHGEKTWKEHGWYFEKFGQD